MRIFLSIFDRPWDEEHAFNVPLPDDLSSEEHNRAVIQGLRERVNAELDRAEEAGKMPRFVYGWDGCGKAI